MEYFTDSKVYEHAYREALRKNSQLTAQIEAFKKELQDVRVNLVENQKHLFQNIMVPIGGKALMRGKLVHTNEVYVNLGDRWFVKTSAARAVEICDRMIGRCNQNLEEFEKETKLLSCNLEIPQELELFPSGDVKDIIEPYDEEAEKRWREKHREEIRKHKMQEAASRMTDDELFERLNRLEEEENEEGLEEGDVETERLSCVKPENKSEENLLSEGADDLISKDVPSAENNSKKRVSFSGVDMAQEHPSSTDEPLIIRFKHSENTPKPEHSTNNDEILSPTDIHRKFLQQYNPKSILKNRDQGGLQRNISNEFSNSSDSDSVEEEEDDVREPAVEAREFKTVNVVGDIVEKIPSAPVKTESDTRPVSKFKKSRAKNLPH